MPRTYILRLGIDEFIGYANRCSTMSDARIRIARRVLVEGESIADVARAQGVTSAAVSGACRQLIGKGIKLPVPRLSDSEFEVVMDGFPRITDSVREAVRLVFVSGDSIRVAATKTGKCRNFISNRVRTIRRRIDAGEVY